ncbi:hypothetical protein [Pseudomonas turukhanskensis]|uniref:DUF3077 domain-containing protein n=1 Tax=Pseudomonas turukhanskensis TaxID=1806536 RepID=A0A9W6K4V9_9PSED|nr:hypothetical protein [Pseudomonas turukhanskensis]GLK88293.1 hypothetical protein GCM10017655_13550 [Pseudomonas turukhanskensis]
MSQPKNTTIPNSAQPLGLTVPVDFHNNTADGGHLLSVNGGFSSSEALTVAAELADGIKMLSVRLHSAVNEGDLIYCEEITALGFLAESVASLVYSVNRSQAVQGGAQ